MAVCLSPWAVRLVPVVVVLKMRVAVVRVLQHLCLVVVVFREMCHEVCVASPSRLVLANGIFDIVVGALALSAASVVALGHIFQVLVMFLTLIG